MVELTFAFVRKTPDATFPTRGSGDAVGFDMYATEGGTIQPGERRLVGTGMGVKMPTWCWLGVYSRSGLAHKSGVHVLNAPGVVDPDYTGEIKVNLYNAGQEPFSWNAGDRIAQAILHEYPDFLYDEVANVEDGVIKHETARGDGGFGSTGL